MSMSNLGFVAVLVGSVLVLSGCQTTAKHAPPPYFPPAPVIVPANPPPVYINPTETQPPPLAQPNSAPPKKISAPASIPVRPERVA